ncbi:MAG: B12-binding domain-containing protein [Acidimicrobiales bacterium]|nr:B12-binding domain-containing protein [Acidimicrobiales bacterium]
MLDARISLQEAADALGVHYMTAYRYVRTGRLPAVKDGAEWRVDPADLADLDVGRRPARGRPGGGGGGGSRWRPAPHRLAARLVVGDEAGVWQQIEDALTSGASPEDVYTALLVPAMAEVGDRWERGEVTVAEEHSATVTVQRVVGRMGPSFTRPGRKRGSIVLGAAPGDNHGLAVSLLADPLRGRGFAVVDLGADVPTEAWRDAVRRAERLRVVGMSLITPGLEPAAAAAIAAVHDAAEVPVVLGGGAVPDEAHARALGADGWAPSHDRALDLFVSLADR